jgi:hypothetical protein
MEYNTERIALLMPEHGRHIQKMIDYAMSIEDREKRNLIAKEIVEIMGQLNPHLRDYEDFRHKLWDHLFIISDFKLDVDSPYPKLTEEVKNVKPEPLNYPEKVKKMRHYGRFLAQIVDKVKDLPEGSSKQQLSGILANFMKKQYLTYNREAVEDNQIFGDLEMLSEGKLKVDESTQLSSTNSILYMKKQNGFNKNANNRKNKNLNQNQKNRKR